jgi:hypothetical protein
MLKRLAFLRMECTSVKWGDYGEDLFGGSRILHEVRPSQRTPMWRRGDDGPPSNFDVALHLDFEDWAAFSEYGADPVHADASDANELVAWDELTARVDWYYDGDSPPTRRGLVKHVAMFLWADHASDADKERALEAAQGLADSEGVGEVMVGHNVGKSTTAYDWVMDIELADRAAAERLLDGPSYGRTMETVAAATKYEWTTRLSHVMRGP